MSRGPLIIFGGTGVFGLLVAEDLLVHTDAHLTLCGRHAARLQEAARRFGDRVTTAVSDIGDAGSVARVVSGSSGVICCAGPFQQLSLNVLRAAIDCRVPYADLADSRAYVRAVTQRGEDIRRAGIRVLPGLSTVPGTSSLLVHLASQSIERIETVHVSFLIGNRNHKGEGAVRSLLDALGERICVPRDGAAAMVTVWTGRESLDFGPPLGRRAVYWIDAPDYDVLPELFALRHVTCKCGFDVDLLNHGLGWLGAMKRRSGLSLQRLSSILIGLSRGLASFGSDLGALRVEVRGTVAGAPKRFVGTITADRGGQRIAAIPAALAGASFWKKEAEGGGIMPMHEWLAPSRYRAELERRGIRWHVALD